MEVSGSVYSDSIYFVRFSNPLEVELTTQESPSRKIIDTLSVDFVYNMRQSDGMNSCGWAGAGFLKGELQYTGFTAYNEAEGKMCADQYDFFGKKLKMFHLLKKQ